MLAGLVAAASLIGTGGGGAPIPTPIGVGPRYRLPATSGSVRAGDRVGRLECGRAGGPRTFAHVELFANRRVLLVPAGVGMAPPVGRDGAYVLSARCSYPVRTTAPTGVIEVAAGARATIGDLFAVWGQHLSRRRLAGFRGAVTAYVSGQAWRGDVRAIPLRRHAQIVLELGGYVPPHRFFLFGPGR